ncbi:MAG: hypothetical protein L0Z62_25135 [Gemmataceae bacterium]|nr:hypothetical protein [Gemmataceae bacterium]
MVRRQLTNRWTGVLAAGLALALAGTGTVNLVLAGPGADPTPPGLRLPPLPAVATPPQAPMLPAAASQEQLRPPMLPSATAPGGLVGPLKRPIESDPTRADPPPEPTGLEPVSLYRTPVDAPTGFTGPSGIIPEEVQDDPHFIPMPDRWRIGYPEYDRYGKGFPLADDYLYKKGHWWDPFNQNVLKGDYPIIGQHTFFVLTASLIALQEERQVPTGTTAFESTANPFQEEFFGKPNQYNPLTFLSLSLELFHGDTNAFRPMDWRIKVTPVFNVNNLAVDELAVVNPDVTRGTTRDRTFFALQEWFVETKLADISPNYDFVSLRAGSQPFNSDFRGLIFADINRGVRLFGNRFANRDQFNIVYFRQFEKDTNSGLNSFNERHQDVFIANYFRQDFIWPGYTAQVSLHYNHDDDTFKFNRNNVLVRPDPVGVFRPHSLDVYYIGWTGDGHINRFNINHALYYAFGRDSLNALANQGQDISAWMAALELSYDRDYVRFRTSYFYASGDNDISNSHATGFDTILDNPQFAGGEFSYWQRQQISLFGVQLTQRQSLVPDLRSSKTQGQSNFVNPGLHLLNFGVDVDVTPKFRIINNVNFLWFDNVNVLRQFVFQDRIQQYIGADLSLGVEYRPLLNNNIIFKFGIAGLIPGAGFKTLFNDRFDNVDPLIAGFAEAILLF